MQTQEEAKAIYVAWKLGAEIEMQDSNDPTLEWQEHESYEYAVKVHAKGVENYYIHDKVFSPDEVSNRKTYRLKPKA